MCINTCGPMKSAMLLDHPCLSREDFGDLNPGIFQIFIVWGYFAFFFFLIFEHVMQYSR